MSAGRPVVRSKLASAFDDDRSVNAPGATPHSSPQLGTSLALSAHRALSAAFDDGEAAGFLEAEGAALVPRPSLAAFCVVGTEAARGSGLRTPVAAREPELTSTPTAIATARTGWVLRNERRCFIAGHRRPPQSP